MSSTSATEPEDNATEVGGLGLSQPLHHSNEAGELRLDQWSRPPTCRRKSFNSRPHRFKRRGDSNHVMQPNTSKGRIK